MCYIHPGPRKRFFKNYLYSSEYENNLEDVFPSNIHGLLKYRNHTTVMLKITMHIVPRKHFFKIPKKILQNY